MYLTISDLLPFLTCKYKGMVRRRDNLWTAPTAPMNFGTAIHDELKSWYTVSIADRATASGNPELFNSLVASLKEKAQRYEAPFDVSSIFGPRIRWAERPIGLQLSDKHMLLMRPDFLYRADGLNVDVPRGRLYWSGQYKTLGKGRSLGRYLEEVRMSPHEISYRTALRRILRPHSVLGTLLVSIRTYLTKAQLAEGAPIVETFYLETTQEEDEAAFEDIRKDLLDLAAAIDSGSARRDWSACFSGFGACPLVQHCHNGASPQDCLSAPLQMRYNDILGMPFVDLDGVTGYLDPPNHARLSDGRG